MLCYVIQKSFAFWLNDFRLEEPDNWYSTVCTTKHPSTSSASVSLSPVSPPDNIFALPAEVPRSSCHASPSSQQLMVSGLLLWPALRYGIGYQTVWEIRLSAETPSCVHWRLFYFQLTRLHSTLKFFGRCTLQVYLLTYNSIFALLVMDCCTCRGSG